ncbi:serine hydrolase domain-containing protein [Saccharothrix sp. ST-888]|uniref:serine hydrolase domain-containing protein n=1 Tax=Saccharothrix sp. ST-888 TaxID=1427391 RepID=UPI0005ECD3B2|nr:serine hydrolase domain-containing protein [Saccharothrix sp. ST-888]KJK56339.1 D-alanyl-D-alanine carboxypeptidase [Saccharothrix sp. ST-888]
MGKLVRRVSALGLACAAAVGTTAVVGGQASASERVSVQAGPQTLDTAALQAAIEPQPGDGSAGAIARVVKGGQVWQGSSGDTVTGRRTPVNAHFHIGSISKTFESVVVLQLAAEGRVDLDQTVQHYLPGLLPDTFAPITVRELLDMTSGLPDVDQGAPEHSADYWIAHRSDYRTFDQVIQDTLRPVGRPAPGPTFAPGTAQQYNSLGFRIAGKLIEQITGNSFRDEVTERIIEPLHLSQTSVPEDDTRMPRPYLHGYLTSSEGEPVDVSEQGGNPSNMISTPADLDHFITALFQGRLLPAAQLDEMFRLPEGDDGKVVKYFDTSNCTDGKGNPGPACFGAGLMGTPLPGGTMLWGKTGHDLGYANGVFATRDLSMKGVFSVSTTDLNNGRATALSGRLLMAVLKPAAH